MSGDEHAPHQERFPRIRLLERATVALGGYPEGTYRRGRRSRRPAGRSLTRARD